MCKISSKISRKRTSKRTRTKAKARITKIGIALGQGRENRLWDNKEIALSYMGFIKNPHFFFTEF